MPPARALRGTGTPAQTPRQMARRACQLPALPQDPHWHKGAKRQLQDAGRNTSRAVAALCQPAYKLIPELARQISNLNSVGLIETHLWRKQKQSRKLKSTKTILVAGG